MMVQRTRLGQGQPSKLERLEQSTECSLLEEHCRITKDNDIVLEIAITSLFMANLYVLLEWSSDGPHNSGGLFNAGSAVSFYGFRDGRSWVTHLRDFKTKL